MIPPPVPYSAVPAVRSIQTVRIATEKVQLPGAGRAGAPPASRRPGSGATPGRLARPADPSGASRPRAPQ